MSSAFARLNIFNPNRVSAAPSNNDGTLATAVAPSPAPPQMNNAVEPTADVVGMSNTTSGDIIQAAPLNTDTRADTTASAGAIGATTTIVSTASEDKLGHSQDHDAPSANLGASLQQQQQQPQMQYPDLVSEMAHLRVQVEDIRQQQDAMQQVLENFVALVTEKNNKYDNALSTLADNNKNMMDSIQVIFDRIVNHEISTQRAFEQVLEGSFEPW